MASKVNTKFVLIAGSIVVLAVIGVAFVGLRMMNAGGDQNITRGDDFMKAGETRKAIYEYGKAVNKDRGNAQWIRTWLGAIEKYTPTTRQQYEDMYRSEYTAALRALCDADRTNPEPFRRVLDELEVALHVNFPVPARRVIEHVHAAHFIGGPERAPRFFERGGGLEVARAGGDGGNEHSHGRNLPENSRACPTLRAGRKICGRRCGLHRDR